MNIYEEYESNVRSYCRRFSDSFSTAHGSIMTGNAGREYIDFFAGAGALNYGHNNPAILNPVIDYLQSGGILHSLDMHTDAKAAFISAFEDKVLKPKGLDYKIMFCGPTGTNAVESALKLARKVKKRTNVFTFSGSFHGMTAGSVSVTSGLSIRESVGVPLANTTFFPYPSKGYENFDSLTYIETVLNDDHSGIEKPAAIILETVQAEGGINIAPVEWLKKLRALCDKYDILMICDEVQVGCNRTGTFFSFERAGIAPDLVAMSKSISGCGFPMALLLIKPELDIWNPGEHNGTFRGFQLSMVGATAAIDFMLKKDIAGETVRKGQIIKKYIEEQILPIDGRLSLRGIGLVWGIDFVDTGLNGAAEKIADLCYKNGLIIETAGRADCVLKLLPALTIEEDLLMKGLAIIKRCVSEFLNK